MRLLCKASLSSAILVVTFSTSSFARHGNTLNDEYGGGARGMMGQQPARNSGQMQQQQQQMQQMQMMQQMMQGGGGGGQGASQSGSREAAKALEKMGQEVRKGIEQNGKAAGDAISKMSADSSKMFSELAKGPADDGSLKDALKALTPASGDAAAATTGTSAGTDGIVSLYADIAKTKATALAAQAQALATQAAQNQAAPAPYTYFERVSAISSTTGRQSAIGMVQASSGSNSPIPQLTGGGAVPGSGVSLVGNIGNGGAPADPASGGAEHSRGVLKIGERTYNAPTMPR